MILIDLFKDKNKLSYENMKMRKCKFEIEQEKNLLQNDLRELQSKYIELLESKSEQFDLYVKYQNQCEELIKEKKN